MNRDKLLAQPARVLLWLFLLFISLSAWEARAADSSGAPGPQIHLLSGSFDPLAAAPEASNAAEYRASEYLLQFTGPVEDAWLAGAEAAGARIHGYVPDFAFIATLEAEAVARVRALPYVRWVGPYLPAYRLSPDLGAGIFQSASRLQPLSVQALPDASLPDLESAVQALGGRVVRRAPTTLSLYLLVELDPARAGELAALPGVLWVEAYHPPQLANRAASEIMRVDRVRPALNLYGKDQIIAIADTGLDTGDAETIHPDLAGQILKVFCLGRPNPDCDWSDPHGHGTHVAGSAVGNGARSRLPDETTPYEGSFAGVAPQARLVFQSILDHFGQLSGIPYDNGLLMRAAYEEGARIHSNSWGGRTSGGNGYGGYSANSQQVDQAAWEMKDLLILFAAGNEGIDRISQSGAEVPDGIVDMDSLVAPGTAKNVLTVGASEGLSSSGGYSQSTWYTFNPTYFPLPPLSGDYISDNPNGMAAFSSRGPTDDGRIKPDLVAPGTNIISLRTQHPDFRGSGWGIFNTDYMYNGGTSMSTPLTAGAAALAREWLEQRLNNPSAALVKALLINGAANISPGQYQNQAEIPALRPNFVSGWGRLDLQDSLMPTGRSVWVQDHRAGLRTGEEIRYIVKLGQPEAGGASGRPLRITLAWTDYPASLQVSRTLVNDLDLEIIAPDGKRYPGNAGLYASGNCLREQKWDTCNNVEGLILNGPPYGTYTIIVRAYNVPRGPQPFALVASGEQLRNSDAQFHQIFLPVFSS